MPFAYQRPPGQLPQHPGPITSVPKPSQQQPQAQNQVPMAQTQTLQQMVSELTVSNYHKVTFSEESMCLAVFPVIDPAQFYATPV